MRSLFPYYCGKFNQLRDILEVMDEHQGTYLLNLSFRDEGMEEIFGKPRQRKSS